MLRGARQIFLDGLIIVLAAFVAFVLREDFSFDPERFSPNLPHVLGAIISILIVWPLMGLQRQVWRHSALRDLLWAAAGCAAVVATGLGIGFMINRLDGVPRAVPPLFLIVAILMSAGARILTRAIYLRRLARRSREDSEHPDAVTLTSSNVLIVGLSPLASFYRRSIREFGAADRVRVVGILSPKLRHRGQLIDQIRVLGSPEDISEIATDLDIQGLPLSRIVVVVPFASLTERAREALLEFEKSHSVHLQLLVEDLGLSQTAPAAQSGEVAGSEVAFRLRNEDLASLSQHGYWRWKRGLDVVLALVLLIILCPIIIFAAAITAARLGMPVIFSQYRPGRNGIPFRLYKLRTMRGVRDADGSVLSDAARLDGFGAFMRRTRIDELPQLWNILIGQMSFVGPRPLLPCDQDPAWRARLVVRPGLTGWAQVVGGRAVSAQDKAALDVWYVRNACFALDLEIVLRTFPMVLKGETLSRDLINRAWSDLRRTDIVMGEQVKGLSIAKTR